MVKFGILTFSECRALLVRRCSLSTSSSRNALLEPWRKPEGVQVIAGEKIIQTPKQARAGAERLDRVGVDGMLFHFVGWSFPHLATVVASSFRGSFLLWPTSIPNVPASSARLPVVSCWTRWVSSTAGFGVAPLNRNSLPRYSSLGGQPGWSATSGGKSVAF